jgi:hypothetical protein
VAEIPATLGGRGWPNPADWFGQYVANPMIGASLTDGAPRERNAPMFLKYREVLDIFMRRLPDTEENKDERFQSNAELYFRACIEILRTFDEDNEGNVGDAEAIELLNKIDLGYGCWLGEIHTAIKAAKGDFPPHYSAFYERFRGASAMADAYLLNLLWMTQKAGKEIVAVLKNRWPDHSVH